MRQIPALATNRSAAIQWATSPASSARSDLVVARWTSDAYRPAEARMAWLDRFARQYGNVERDDAPFRRPFRLRMESYRLGSMGVSFVECLWSRLSRPAGTAIQDEYWLFQPRCGITTCNTPRGEFIVRPGECFLFDLAEPFSLECYEPSAGVSLTFPKQWLSRWLPRPERCSPLFPNTGDWSAALCSVVSTLHPDTICKLTVPAASIAENVAVLLTLAAGPASQARSLPLLESLRSTLNGGLHEPGLSASQVAKLHHISLRTLHYTFANAQTTFLRELLQMRLDRAREVLMDQSLSRLEIAAVADRCGFADPSHFARRFRQRFGQAPLQYRRSLRTRTS